jgi:hypothetical protein
MADYKSEYRAKSGNICNFEQKERGPHIALAVYWRYKPTENDKQEFKNFIEKRLTSEGAVTQTFVDEVGSRKRTPEIIRQQQEQIEKFLHTGLVPGQKAN